MPTLNQKQYIRRAIDSILTQPCPAEIIVVDGGSTDGSLDILASYGSAIRYISEPDRGQSDAVNKGLKLATGEIVGWLNSDDVYKPDAFQHVRRAFENAEIQWIFGKVDVIDADGREIRRWVTRIKNRRLPRMTFGKLLQANWISSMGVFWRSDFQQQVGELRLDHHLAMDYDWWLRFWKKSPGTFLNQSIASFRMYGASKSGSSFHKQLDEAYAIACDHADNRHALDLLRHRTNRLLIAQLYGLSRWFTTSGRAATKASDK
jgi:glycosyltransferase involved in cell wall biosynthesis